VARDNALRIASAWNIKHAEFVEVDNAGVEATRSGLIIVGKSLPSRLNASPDSYPELLTFILLHELWHIKQLELVDRSAIQNPKERPALECQADIEAAHGLISHYLGEVSDLSDKLQIERASKKVGAFRASWSALVDHSLAESDTHYHLTKRERTLALQFGLWRAYSEAFSSAKNMTPAARELATKLKSRSNAKDSVPLHSWSRSTCNNIVGYDREVLGRLYFTIEPAAGLDLDTGTEEIKIGVKNTYFRDIEVSATVLVGHYPANNERALEQYTFTDAQTESTIVRGGANATLTFRVVFPSSDDGSKVFVWSMPFEEQALLAATYSSAPRPPPSCNESWSARDAGISSTIIDLARLGSFAPDRFADVITDIRSVFGIADVIQKSSVPVRGASKVEIYVSSDPTAVATLYSGPDKAESFRIFQASASAMKDACKELSDQTQEWVSKDGNPNILIKRLTAYSEATLTISNRKSQEAHAEYEVQWSLKYNPP
jgi:hypothetical protein